MADICEGFCFFRTTIVYCLFFHKEFPYDIIFLFAKRLQTAEPPQPFGVFAISVLFHH